MEKKLFNSVHSVRQDKQGTGDDSNSAAPVSRPPSSLPAMVPTVFDTKSYDELLDNDALYSVYSPRRSNTPQVVESGPMQTNNYEDLMPSEYDMEVHAGLLAQQLRSSHIMDPYARVQESLPAMAYNAVTGFDLNKSWIPYNSYEFDLGTPNYSRHERSYSHRQDNLVARSGNVPTNSRYHGYPSFAGNMAPTNRRFSSNSLNSGSTVTPKIDHEGNRCSVLLDLLSDTENLFETMKSKHGNYTFQKLLALCDEEQKKDIVVRVSEDPRRLVELATDEFGRLSFNKLIAEVSTSPNLCEYIMFALSSELLDLMTRPQNGPAVIKYLLGQLHPNNISTIFKVALEHFNLLSRDKIGCISLNYCFSKLCQFEYQEKPAKGYKCLLLTKLIDNSVELAANDSGNFVVQHVIRLGITEYTYMICNKLKDSVHQLSLSKPGSFVLQTCLESSGRMIILQALLTNDTQILHQITMHPYGNYVMQSAMNVLMELPPDDKLVQAMQQFPAKLKHSINRRNMVKRK